MDTSSAPQPTPRGRPFPRRPSPLTDEAALSAILALAGPSGAALLAQIEADLTDVRQKILAALPATDHDLLRRATHVLISLAGTIGAPRMQADAVSLNEAAHDAGWEKVLSLAGPLLTDLSALIGDVAGRQAGARP